jgi:hypothetical protein
MIPTIHNQKKTHYQNSTGSGLFFKRILFVVLSYFQLVGCKSFFLIILQVFLDFYANVQSNQGSYRIFH